MKPRSLDSRKTSCEVDVLRSCRDTSSLSQNILDVGLYQSPVPNLSVRPLLSAAFSIINLAYIAVSAAFLSWELNGAVRQQSSVIRT
jgi:hypothetical protein